MIYRIIFAILLPFVFLTPTHAQSLTDQINGQIGASAEKAEVTQTVDPRTFVAGIIQTVLSLVGIVFLILILMAGYWIFTAKGDEAQVEKGQNTIKAAIIGLIITLAAYSITLYVGSKTQEASSGDAFNRPTPGLQYNDLVQ